MDLFDNKGMLISGVLYLTPKEAFSLSGSEVVFIDLRNDYETAGKRILVKSLVYIPWQEFENQYDMLDNTRHFIVFDDVGIHSKEIVKRMIEKGFQHVAGMAGGIFDWERDGLPVDITKSELLTGSCACTLRPKKNFFLLLFVIIMVQLYSCSKHDDIVPENTTNTIKIDSIVPTKRNLIVWEESHITVFAQGQNLRYKWEADHGSMIGTDMTTVVYWACPSCLGTNTIKCVVSNEYGSVSDTVMVHVTD